MISLLAAIRNVVADAAAVLAVLADCPHGALGLGKIGAAKVAIRVHGGV
jgi:hypothetical protein